MHMSQHQQQQVVWIVVPTRYRDITNYDTPMKLPNQSAELDFIIINWTMKCHQAHADLNARIICMPRVAKTTRRW